MVDSSRIDTSLARAATLPSSAYLEPAVFEREKERIFWRTWQLVARADDLARPGDFVPATVLDEPIVLVRGLDEQLRGFYNVCRHRAGQVALSRGIGRASSAATTAGPTASTEPSERRPRWKRPRTSTRATSVSCP